MQVNYTSFDKALGYNCKNKEKPFYLLQPIYVIVSCGNKKNYLKLHNGTFTSDGCSIPWIFRLFLGCKHKPEYVAASIIHDYIIENPQTVNYNRKLSSQIFYNVLLQEKVNKYLAYVLYLGVEIGQIYNTIFKGKWRTNEQRTLNI